MILIIQIWTNLSFSNLNNVNFFSNYRYDTRGEDKSYEEARHWSDDKVLTGRAFFRGDHDPGRLILDNVGAKDQGVYKCRVDFRKAPTRISNVNLNVIGEKNLEKTVQTIYVNLNIIEENFVQWGHNGIKIQNIRKLLYRWNYTRFFLLSNLFEV